MQLPDKNFENVTCHTEHPRFLFYYIHKQFNIPVGHTGCPEFSWLFLPISCASEQYACQQHCFSSCACWCWLSLWMPWKVFGHGWGGGGGFSGFDFVFQVLTLQWCFEHEVLTLPWHLSQSVMLSIFSVRGKFQIDWFDPLQNQIFLNYMCSSLFIHFVFVPCQCGAVKKKRL